MSVDASGGGIVVAGLPCIAFFISAGLGIPGVGVTPGLMPRLSSSGLGIPGVGVPPFGKTVFVAGIPGVVFADGCTGCGFIPSGIFAGSILIGPDPTPFTAVFALALALAGAPPPQPNDNAPAARIILNDRNFVII